MIEPTTEERARAKRVAGLRHAANLSQQQLAAQIGVSRSAVAQWEGAHSSPGTDVLVALASALGVTTDALLAPPSEDEIAAVTAGAADTSARAS